MAERFRIVPTPAAAAPHAYIVITGTGRAGTTLLVRLLTRLGLDTGYAPDTPVDGISHAGLERSVLDRPACRIVKSPWIMTQLPAILAAPDIRIDHAIFCVRDLAAAAESRRRVEAAAPGREPPGGLWLTRNPRGQEAVLASLFHDAVVAFASREIPMSFLEFPRFARDSAYLARVLGPVFPDVAEDDWAEAARQEVRPEWIGTGAGPAVPRARRIWARLFGGRDRRR